MCPCYAYSFAVAKLPPGIYIFFLIFGKNMMKGKRIKGKKRRIKVKKGEKREKKSIMD